MRKLIELEIQRNNIKKYVIAAMIITVSSFMMLYLFAFMARFGSDEEFFDYKGIISIIGIVNMACFTVLGSVMYSRFVIDDYVGKKAILIFSYPVSRNKVFYSKVLLVSSLVIGGTLLSNLLIFGIFFCGESIFPIVQERLNGGVVISGLFMAILSSIIAGGFSIISMSVGLKFRSVPITIVTAVIVCAMFSNVLSLFKLTIVPTILVAIVATLLALIVLGSLSSKIDELEV